MTPQEIKEQVIRLEAFSDGFRNCSQVFAQWLVAKLEQESAVKSNLADSVGSKSEDN